MKAHKIISSLIIATMLVTHANTFASVLGSSEIDGYTVQVGEGTHFTHKVFYSDQSGVGQQSENYIIYEPNSQVTPIITNGSGLYGSSTISNELEYLAGNGTNVVGGSNADFFSFQTGVPMSNAIVDGKILTKDSTTQAGLGILEDGTAFISSASFASVLIKEDGSETNIYNINKYRQPYAIYMMTEEFSDYTQNTTDGIDVILGSIEGEMRLGTQMTAVVEAVNRESSSAPIPKGKIVLTVDSKAPSEFYEPIAALSVGEKVTISFGVVGDERWQDVQLGICSIGGVLLTNGEVNPDLEKGAAPRTAIGIRQDGSILLYTIDGRQSGHSYGVQLKTLATRMKELGCVDAINLDGGGSTSIVCRLPGDEAPTLVNKPSDGRERKVSNFVFFKNNAERTGSFANLHIYPLSNYVLTNSQLQLSLKATDSGFYPVDVPDNVGFSVENGKNSTVSDSGVFTAKDDGVVRVFAEKDGVSAYTDIVCLSTPTDIIVKNKANGERVESLSLDPSAEVALSADAYGGYNKLVSQNESFVWSCDENIGSIDQSGTFTASTEHGEKGNIYVRAGEYTVTLPVQLTPLNTASPDAFPQVEITLNGNSLSGKVTGGGLIPVLKDGIILQCDGRPCDFSFNVLTGNFTATIPQDTHKITVYVTNTSGHTNTTSTFATERSEYENPFADTNGHWAEDILSYMYSSKVISGEPVNGQLMFNPQKEMTRCEFAVMVANYLGLSDKDYSHVSLPYTDIDSIPAWALNSFKALYEKGIVKGRYVSDTESYADPLSSITRAEAATVVARTIPEGLYKVTISAPDKKDIPNWAAGGMNTLIKIGAMNGYQDGTLLPMRKLTKAEAAKILYYAM